MFVGTVSEMKVAIFGSTGGTGRIMVGKALDRGCHRGSPKPSRASVAPRASAGGRGGRDAAGVPIRGRGGPGRRDHERLGGKRPEGGAQAHDPLLRRHKE